MVLARLGHHPYSCARRSVCHDIEFRTHALRLAFEVWTSHFWFGKENDKIFYSGFRNHNETTQSISVIILGFVWMFLALFLWMSFRIPESISDGEFRHEIGRDRKQASGIFLGLLSIH